MVAPKVSRRVGRVMGIAASMVALSDAQKAELRREMDKAEIFADLPQVWKFRIRQAEREVGVTA